MSPEPCSTMPSIAAWVMYIRPSTLVSIIRRQSSGRRRTIVPSSITPALLTRTSRPPSSSRVRRTASAQACSSVTSRSSWQHRRAAVAEPCRRARRAGHAAGADGDGRAGLGQRDGGGLADARGGAGDQGDLAGQRAGGVGHVELPPRAAGCGARSSPAPARAPARAPGATQSGRRRRSRARPGAAAPGPAAAGRATRSAAGGLEVGEPARVRPRARAAGRRAARRCWPTPSAAPPEEQRAACRLAGAMQPVEHASAGRRPAASATSSAATRAASTPSIRSWSRRRRSSSDGVGEVLGRHHRQDSDCGRSKLMCAFMPSSTCASGGSPGSAPNASCHGRGDAGVAGPERVERVEVEVGEVDDPGRHPAGVLEPPARRGRHRPPGSSAGRCRGRTGPGRRRALHGARAGLAPCARRARRSGRHGRLRRRRQTSASRPSSGGSSQPGLDRRPVRLVEAAHPGRVQRQQQVQPQRRVGGERAEQPLELADPVAHRVVVEVQPAGRLGHVEVGLQQHPQRLAQVGGVGVGGVGQRAEHLVDVGAQLGAVRDQRQQPEHPELVEVGDRRPARGSPGRPRARAAPAGAPRPARTASRPAGRCRCRARRPDAAQPPVDPGGHRRRPARRPPRACGRRAAAA